MAFDPSSTRGNIFVGSNLWFLWIGSRSGLTFLGAPVKFSIGATECSYAERGGVTAQLLVGILPSSGSSKKCSDRFTRFNPGLGSLPTFLRLEHPRDNENEDDTVLLQPLLVLLVKRRLGFGEDVIGTREFSVSACGTPRSS